MGLKDFLVTPVIIFVVYLIANMIRTRVADNTTRKYFFPALTLKIIGAISVGLIYQFYYGGGDTFAYHTNGSSIIWEAFMDSPIKGIKLLFANGSYVSDTYEYYSRIWYYHDPASYMVIRIAALFDLLTFGTYSATAVLFAIFSFSGLWALFVTFYKIKPQMHLMLAIAIFFVPSVFFWGSGILKDTITLGALGWCTYAVYKLFIENKRSAIFILILLVNAFLIFSIKKYILLTFLPAALIWIATYNLKSVKLGILNFLLVPSLLSITLLLSYFAVVKVGEDDPRYAIQNLSQTVRITAYDIRYGWGKDAGSHYTLGNLDGTVGNMVRLAPSAINVSLFRPYLWEVNNPLMLIYSLEAFAILILTIYALFKTGLRSFITIVKQPAILFCLIFSLSFAFAVGVSTFNFGTLARYKIVMVPFYLIVIFSLIYYSKSDKKLSELELTE